MTQKYYLSNIHWGVIIFGICVLLMREDLNEPLVKLILWLSFFSGVLFPFAKKATEKVALRYSSSEDWTSGSFIETPMKNGLYAMFYLLIFIVTIPLSIIYGLYCLSNKKAM